MKKIICLILGHKEKSHLDYIYGSLAREHTLCERCNKCTKFEQCTEERVQELPLVDCF